MNAKFAVLLIAGLTAAGAAWGQTTTLPGDDKRAAPEASEATGASPSVGDADHEFISEQPADHTRAENIIGMKVTNAAGDEIGRISDIILDKDGKLSGLVIEAGGVLGFGAKQVAISTRSLPVTTDQGAKLTLLGITADDLQTAPEFRTTEERQREMERERQRAQPPR